MAKYLEAVAVAAQSGSQLIIVQDSAASEYRAKFRKQDPQDFDRPIITWDPDNGFIDDDLPAATELPAALDTIRDYQGGAIFLLDCQSVDLSASDKAIGRRLTKVSERMDIENELLVVLFTDRPIAAAYAKTVKWIGDAPSSAGPVRSASPAGQSRAVDEFLAKASQEAPDAFDTPECEKYLEQMSQEDIEALIKRGGHEHSIRRVNELRSYLKKRYAQKEDIIDALTAAAVSQVPTVLIGPPGVAKGHMIRSLCEGLGLTTKNVKQAENGEPQYRQYFEYQLTQFTSPEEIFGPINVQDLIHQSVYRRVTAGYLPTAQVAFLDEIFKASSAILNTMLSILNERVFYNEGHPEKVPLTVVFAASNEAPTDQKLSALYDRFPIRLNCARVDENRLDDLLLRSWEDSFDQQFQVQRVVPRLACANDLRLLHRVMRASYGGRGVSEPVRPGRSEFRQEFVRTFRTLRNDYRISDRTITPLMSFCRAQALLAGKQHLAAAELDVFKHISWDESGELARSVDGIKREYRL